jgi:hypothetical protein
MKRSANMQTTQVECVTFVQNLFSTVCTWKGTGSMQHMLMDLLDLSAGYATSISAAQTC